MEQRRTPPAVEREDDFRGRPVAVAMLLGGLRLDQQVQGQRPFRIGDTAPPGDQQVGQRQACRADDQYVLRPHRPRQQGLQTRHGLYRLASRCLTTRQLQLRKGIVARRFRHLRPLFERGKQQGRGIGAGFLAKIHPARESVRLAEQATSLDQTGFWRRLGRRRQPQGATGR